MPARLAWEDESTTLNYGVGGAALPTDLAHYRLPIRDENGDRLKMSRSRFVPRNTEEMTSSIFTWWNLLDSVMLEYDPGAKMMGDYIQELLLRRMLKLVRAPNVSTYCEIGLNGGHSLAAMLVANPGLNAHVFDLMRRNYSRSVVGLLRMRFGASRVVVHQGYSWKALEDWSKVAAKSGTRCDLVLLDGGRTESAARMDLKLLRELTAPDAQVVIDDVNAGPGLAVRRFVKQKIMRVLESYHLPKRTEHNPCLRSPPLGKRDGAACSPWGFAVAQYIPRKNLRGRLNDNIEDDAFFKTAFAKLRPSDVPIFSITASEGPMEADRIARFNATAAMWGLPLVPIGFEMRWTSTGTHGSGFHLLATKYSEAAAQLAMQSPRQVAVMMDSQDGFVQGTAEEVARRFRAAGRPILLGLETGCPPARCATPAPRPGEPSDPIELVGIANLTHINGGIVVGEAAALKLMWRYVAKHTHVRTRDANGNVVSRHSAQHGIGAFVEAHPNMVAFDRTQMLTATINELGAAGHKPEFSRYYDVEQLAAPRIRAGLLVRRHIVNKRTRTAPCFIHVPGTQEYKRDWAVAKPAMRTWDEITATLVPTAAV